MKNKFIYPLCLLLLGSVCLFAQIDNVEIQSEIAILMNVDTKKVLYEKNAHQKTPPASITKVATALYALKEVGDELDVKIEADQDCIGSITDEMQKTLNYKHPPHWLVIGGTHMSIAKGEKLTLEELLYGLMLVSANDAANIIGKYVGGSISQFMVDLNDYLAEIGCKNTHFRNPHGLHLPEHYTTAYDMALITCEALKYPLFKKIINTERYLLPNRAKDKKGLILNSNPLISPGQKHYYPHAIGGKTGTHSHALNSFIGVASHKGRNLIVVLMRCPSKNNLFEDARHLFDAAFNEGIIEETYLKKGAQLFQKQIEGAKHPLKTYLKDELQLSYYPSEKPEVKGEIHWLKDDLPINKGDYVADLRLTDSEGNVLKEEQLFAANTLKEKNSLGRIAYYCFFIIGITALFMAGNYFIRRASKN